MVVGSFDANSHHVYADGAPRGVAGATEPPLPVATGCHNMAWAFQADGTITSGIPDKCLGMNSNGRMVNAVDSTTASNCVNWELVGGGTAATVKSADGMCALPYFCVERGQTAPTRAW